MPSLSSSAPRNTSRPISLDPRGVPDSQASAPLGLLRGALVGMVAQDAPDLSARQLAVLLTVHLDPAPHTVRGLAAKLRISKPAVTRALDRLEHLTLAQRTIDAMDRRSVLISLRSGASTFLENLRSGALAAGDAQ